MSEDKGAWFIKVRGTVYGPYSDDRMQGFIKESRVGARSLVSHDRDGDFERADDNPVMANWLSLEQESAPQQTPVATVSAQSGPRRFVIFTQLSSASRAGFVDTLADFGVALEVMPGLWLLSANSAATQLRNALTHNLQEDDQIFIADASMGQSAWFNIGQEADARIREFWQNSES